MSKSRLGRGLGSIIQPSTTTDTARTIPPAPVGQTAESVRQDGYVELRLDQIHPNRNQPRQRIDPAALEALAASIRESGVIQPVIVRRSDDGTYELIAGERRWRAARIAGLETIPAVIREASHARALEWALIENLQREDLTPLERAAAYQHYLNEFGGTVEGLAARLGESRSNVANYLRLLSLPKQVQDLLADGSLQMGHARALLMLQDAEQQLRLARLAIRRALSVREVEARAKRLAASGATASEAPATAASGYRRHMAELERSLSQALGLPVRIQPGRKKNSGRVVISYNSLDEFDRIAERLGGRVDPE